MCGRVGILRLYKPAEQVGLVSISQNQRTNLPSRDSDQFKKFARSAAFLQEKSEDASCTVNENRLA
jgi:hypothetical protein